MSKKKIIHACKLTGKWEHGILSFSSLNEQVGEQNATQMPPCSSWVRILAMAFSLCKKKITNKQITNISETFYIERQTAVSH